MQTRFCVGNINPGTVRTEFMQSVIGLLQNPKSDDHGTVLDQLVFNHSGPYLDVGRNEVVERFLDVSDAEVLLFVDSDMEFTPDQAHGVVAKVTPEQPIVGGWYSNFYSDYGHRPVALNWGDVLDDKGHRLMVPIEQPEPDSGLVSVGCVGTGFMAIHRSLLDRMTGLFRWPAPWFAEEILFGSHMGEDVTFCQRAVALDYPVLLDTHTRLDHFKSVRIGPVAASPEYKEPDHG